MKPRTRPTRTSPPPDLIRGSTNRQQQFVDGRVKPGQGDKRGSWDDYFRNGPHASENFMTERDQGVAEEREPFC
jgi:hypothetical protein